MNKNAILKLSVVCFFLITFVACDSGNNKPFDNNKKEESDKQENPAKVHLDWMWSERTPCTEKICSDCAIKTDGESEVKLRGSLSAHDCVVEAKKATDPKLAENWLLCAQSHNLIAQKIIHDEIQWCLEYIKTLN